MLSNHSVPSSQLHLSSSSSSTSSSSSQEIPYSLLQNSPPPPADQLTPTSINPSNSTPTPTTTVITNFHHQPLELLNSSWSTTTNPTTSSAAPSAATSSSPTSFLTLNNLDNCHQLNLFLKSRTTQPTDMTSKTDAPPSPIAPLPSSSSSSSQSSSSSPSSHQKPHPLFDSATQIENKMINLHPLSPNDNLAHALSNHTHNNTSTTSFYMDNNYISRPSTAPTASFWSHPNNSTIIKTPTPATHPSASAALSSTHLADLLLDDALKAFPYPPQHNLPPSTISGLNQLIPPSHTHTHTHPHNPPHPFMMMNPSQDLIPHNDLVSAPHYHDISSPHSPSGGRLITHTQLHAQHHPIYQHPYNSLSSISSPIDHQSFPLPIQHPHPHLDGWHPSFDPLHTTTFYDPFQIKHRRRTTPSQLSVLEAQFQTNCKPDVSLRKQLADQLDMTPREVQVWFQNRRAKTKKLERRAEQESGKSAESDSIPNSSRPTASPPASVYLSSPSLRGIALPVAHESPEEARIRVSPPMFVTGAANSMSKNEEGEQEAQHRLESDRRYRSRSLHHHPYYLPSLNTFNVPAASAPNSLIGARMLNQQHQFVDGGDESSMKGRRSSNTSNASSTATATDSNLLCTPTTTEFSNEHTVDFPDGYDPRRRSSCPAEFIQSFGHFGLAMNQSSDRTSQTGLQASFISTGESVINSALDSNSNPFTMLADQNQECIKSNGYTNDATREGIQRRHSLATMNSPTESQGNPHGNISTTDLNVSTGFPPLFSIGTTRYPTPVLSGIDNSSSNGIKPNVTRGGYVRRASTSVLKSIEEHPGNV